MPFADAAAGYAKRFREQRFELVLGLIDKVIARNGSCRLIDIGGTCDYWRSMQGQLAGRKVDIVAVNLLPQGDDTPGVSSMVGNATDLAQFADNSFDLVHSNSVIEHVGLWSNMVAMAREVRRLAPAYYVQTPNFWFPYDPHSKTLFFQWLPVPMRAWLLLRGARGHYPKAADIGEAMNSAEDARCLTRTEMAHLFPDAELHGEHALGMVKSWMAIRAPA